MMPTRKRPVFLLHEFVTQSADCWPDQTALIDGDVRRSYAELAIEIESFAMSLVKSGLNRGDRVGIYLNKRVEWVIAAFGTARAGGVFVPINPILKPQQVSHIAFDCQITVLVTSPERFSQLTNSGVNLESLRLVLLADGEKVEHVNGLDRKEVQVNSWSEFIRPSRGDSRISLHRIVDADILAIFYTSGSTGKPKGVVLSHRNMVVGATSVASYLENHAKDVLLAALPLSFDAGFSQLTTAFSVGATVVLQDYLLPHELRDAVIQHRVTGLTGVPPLWIQLAQQAWPAHVTEHLRYFANTGGRMPLETLKALRLAFPKTKPYLMYGLTEAFRATYLPPEEIDRRPDSIGRAIPNTEVLVLRDDGRVCADNEPGELVQRGALVAQGYWNNPEFTHERFKPLQPSAPGRHVELMIAEMAVFSGDVVTRDSEGFLYFIGRRDEMIKTSGYRVSPVEVEEIFYQFAEVSECAAFGLPHAQLGQTIAVVVTLKPKVEVQAGDLIRRCRSVMPSYMVPTNIELRRDLLPRNSNGKIDRKSLAQNWVIEKG